MTTLSYLQSNTGDDVSKLEIHGLIPQYGYNQISMFRHELSQAFHKNWRFTPMPSRCYNAIEQNVVTLSCQPYNIA